jgi:hypothetical protein
MLEDETEKQEDSPEDPLPKPHNAQHNKNLKARPQAEAC